MDIEKILTTETVIPAGESSSADLVLTVNA